MIDFNTKEGRQAYRHTSAHIMAQAVKRLWPDTQLAIGPAIEDGFYYDFDREKNFDKDDLEAIEKEMKHVDDDELRKQLRKMQGIAKNFLTYLQQHPERMSLARRFVDYYQDRALLLVRKYQELEKTGLESQEVQQSKWEIKQLLDKFDEAYEDQFSKVLNAQLMDLDAEMKVMKQNMAADGIQTEPPKVEPQAKRSDDLVGTIIDLADQFLNTKRK